jgi:hypothetical protein
MYSLGRPDPQPFSRGKVLAAQQPSHSPPEGHGQLNLGTQAPPPRLIKDQII